MNWFDTGTHLLRYTLRPGQGPWLVLVHEMGGSIESWDRVLEHLPPDQAVLVPEMRGMGLSQKLSAPTEFTQIAADIAALLDHLRIFTPVILSGCAIGGGVALKFALDYPERCAGVAPLDPALSTTREGAEFGKDLAHQMESEGLRPMEPILLDRTYPERYRLRDRAHFERVRGLWYANDPHSFAEFFRMLGRTDLRPDLGRLSCPVLYGSGLHDALRPPEYVHALAAVTPGARVHNLDAAHHVPDQAPEETAALLNSLLEWVRSPA